MTILFIVPRLPAPPHDGGALYVFQSAKAMADFGHTVCIAGFRSNLHTQNEAILTNFAHVFSVDAGFTSYGLLSAIRSIVTAQPISVQHRMDVGRMRAALEKVNLTPDVILLEGIQTAQFIDLCRSKFPSVPILLRQVNNEHVLLYRNSQSSSNRAIRLFYWLQSQFMKRFERNAMSKVDGVTSISSKDISDFKQLCPNQLFHEASPGIDIPSSKCVERKPDQLLAMAGWAWKPNIDGLIWFLESVWPNVSELRPQLQFHIAGKDIPTSIISHFESDSVRFLGFVDDGEQLRQQSTVMIAPLFSGSGIKMKVMEAFGSGLPVITTPIGIEGIPVENGRHVMVFETDTQAVDHILKLTDDAALQESIRSCAFEFAKTWNWNSKAAALTDFIRARSAALSFPKRLSMPNGG